MRRKLLISDANILIDLIAGGVLEETFALHYAFAVPDVLFHEELREQHPDLPERGLNVLELGADAINDTVLLSVKHARSGVSSNDFLALALARQEACPLLTGDAALRQVSILEDVEVRGTIWLMGELLEANLITVDRAASAYNAMRVDGSRLPWRDVDAQIEAFKNSREGPGR